MKRRYSHLQHARAARNKVATLDDVATRLLSRLASNAHTLLGLPQDTPHSAIRLIRAYFGRPDAVHVARPERLDGRAASWRRGDDLDATFMVDQHADPVAMQRDLSRAFAEYLLMLPEMAVPFSRDAVEMLARQLTVTDRCVLDDYATVGNNIEALSAWWMLEEVETVLRIHEVLRASMPSGVVRAAGGWSANVEIARSA